MTELTIKQMKQISGVKMSGALLSGIAAIINACSNSLTSLITTGFSIAFATQQKNLTEGSYKAGSGHHLT